jgi:hypothetical protein
VVIHYVTFIALLLLTGGCGTTEPPRPEPRAARGLDEAAKDTWAFPPYDVSRREVSACFFVATECPISNGYAPEMARIVREYGSRVRFSFVYADPDVTREAGLAHAREYGLTGGAFVIGGESARAMARERGATLTPEAAVTSRGKVVYLGRIDDLYVGFGKRRHEPTVRDLRNALDAVLAGKPVPPPGGRAIGCSIPGV